MVSLRGPTDWHQVGQDLDSTRQEYGAAIQSTSTALFLFEEVGAVLITLNSLLEAEKLADAREIDSCFGWAILSHMAAARLEGLESALSVPNLTRFKAVIRRNEEILRRTAALAQDQVGRFPADVQDVARERLDLLARANRRPAKQGSKNAKPYVRNPADIHERLVELSKKCSEIVEKLESLPGSLGVLVEDWRSDLRAISE